MTGGESIWRPRLFGNIHRVNQLAGAMPRFEQSADESFAGQVRGRPASASRPNVQCRGWPIGAFRPAAYPKRGRPQARLIVDTFYRMEPPGSRPGGDGAGGSAWLAVGRAALARPSLLRPARDQQGFAGQRQGNGDGKCAWLGQRGCRSAFALPRAKLHERLHRRLSPAC